MNAKEFIQAILNADEETIKVVCQLLEVDQLLFEPLDLPSDIARKIV